MKKILDAWNELKVWEKAYFCSCIVIGTLLVIMGIKMILLSI